MWVVDGVYDLVLLASSLYWETTDVLTHSHAKAVDAYPGDRNVNQCSLITDGFDYRVSMRKKQWMCSKSFTRSWSIFIMVDDVRTGYILID